MVEKQYYNAKPSVVGNLGVDVAGAHRMRFDTYETDAEKREKRERNKELKSIREELKAAILSDCPCYQEVIKLLSKEFEVKFGFSPTGEGVDDEIKACRLKVIKGGLEERKEFNKMVRAYSQVHKNIRGLNNKVYGPYRLEKLRCKYKPRAKAIGEITGETIDWKSYKQVAALQHDLDYLERNSTAVQFGNSVTDRERSYIAKRLSDFIFKWRRDSTFGRLDITAISWSFGARGKAGSVAYYQPSGKIISVNRNNQGSLVHELGHFLDYQAGEISKSISLETVKRYRDSLRGQGLSGKELAYYCSREEIFARAFEAYCYKVKAQFGSFAQSESAYLPELCDALMSLIERLFAK